MFVLYENMQIVSVSLMNVTQWLGSVAVSVDMCVCVMAVSVDVCVCGCVCVFVACSINDAPRV